jgi:hypothetical protein
MPNHYFDVDDFRRFLERYPTYGDPENRPLYLLFGMDREHAVVEVTQAKVKYIDRIYTANIGAGVGKSGADTEGLQGVYWLARKLHDDEGFRELMSDAQLLDGLNSKNVNEAITHVHRFGKIINSTLPKYRETRSFCSKYLYFHSLAHPIYDSNTSTALPLMLNRSDWRSLLQDPARKEERDKLAGDMSYAELCVKEFELLRWIFPDREAFQSEVKQLDHYLIALYRREWPL